ncbi:MAG TPA: CBS domain-containing protein, partial [Polyangia bacterium]|nr:CBS domain-containing protein [Polyangia bacterium]
LMLAEGIAFVALRKQSLYHAQVPTKRQSAVHQTPSLDILRAARVAQVMRPVSLSGVPVVAPDLRVGPDDDLRTATQTLLANKLREIPVTDAAGQIVGLLDEADISRYYLDASTKTPSPMAS